MNDDKHVALTFAARCAIATGCLPRDEYRAKLEALHAEMLAAIADERERCAKVCEAQTEPNPHLYYEVRRTALNLAAAIRGAA